MNLSASYTDLYQLAMAQVYFNVKPNGKAVFDYYYRSNPFDGGYAIFAGLEDVLEILETLKFSASDLKYLEEQGFESGFIEYLKDFRFRGNIYSCREGDVIFPNRPILQVEANIIEAQIIETLLLNFLNFQSLIATKASRIRYSAPRKTLLDMGLRRAHATGGYYASRAAIIGGFDGTSNVKAAADYNILSSGTMAHSFIQSYGDELQAFRDFAKFRPENCVFLVDTYDTLKSGLPNAITVAKEMESKGKQLMGVRLDSGDLAYLSKKARMMLDDAGLNYVKIVASNQLDEYVINSLRDQDAKIDVYGVGTNLVTGNPDAAFNGVYKLSEFDGEPRIKISENIIKISLPCRKQVYRVLDENGMFYGADAVALASEVIIDEIVHPFDSNKSVKLAGFTLEPLLEEVVVNGNRISELYSVKEISEYSQIRLGKLPDEYRRFQNPHIYKVGLSTKLKDERDKLILKHKA